MNKDKHLFIHRFTAVIFFYRLLCRMPQAKVPNCLLDNKQEGYYNQYDITFFNFHNCFFLLLWIIYCTKLRILRFHLIE